MRVTVQQTADHYLVTGDRISLEDKVYQVREVEQLGPPEFVLGYNYQLIPAKVVVRLEKVEEEAA